MADVFTLRIELGNDAMQVARDVGNALGAVRDHLQEAGEATAFGGPIRDENGNTVGQYYVASDDAE